MGYKDTLRKCVVCGDMFSPTQHNQKYCCQKCYKEAAKARNKQWLIDNKERHKETQKFWKLQNPHKVKEYRKRYEATHKDEIAQRHKKWRKDNPEKYKAGYEKFNKNKQMYRCSKKHNDCFDCPTEDGECKYD